MYAEPVGITWTMFIASGIALLLLGSLYILALRSYREEDHSFFHKVFGVFTPIVAVLLFLISYNVVQENYQANETKEFQQVYNVDITTYMTREGVVGDIPHIGSQGGRIVSLYFMETGKVEDCYVSLDENNLYNVVCDGEDITLE